MSSFWMAWMVIVTLGCSFWKAATVSSQYFLPSPVVELCQKVMATGVALDDAGADPEVLADGALPPEQAASRSAALAPSAINAGPLTVHCIRKTSQSSLTVRQGFLPLAILASRRRRVKRFR